MGVAEESTEARQTGGVPLLASLASGHMAIHWFQQLWPVIIPSIKTTFGLSDVQLGTLSSVRHFTGGPLWFPAGVFADVFRNWTTPILAGAIAIAGISHVLLGLSSNYAWLMLTVALLGIGPALWHPTALATLSLRFPERRGSAVAVHGVGASVGDTLAPLGIGALLLTLEWRNLLHLQVIPAILVALLLWRGLGTFYKSPTGSRPPLSSFWVEVKVLLRHRVFLAILGVNTLTGMGRLATLTFLPVYLQEHLGYSTFVMGFHIALLHMMGVVSGPGLGYLSDKFGRKTVLLPSLVLFGLLYLTLAGASSGIQLGLAVGALGVFFYALSTVTTATVMDVASARAQAATMGASSFLGQIFTIPSPIIAGFIVEGIGIKAVFIYASIVTLLSALLLAVIHVPRSTRPTPRMAG